MMIDPLVNLVFVVRFVIGFSLIRHETMIPQPFEALVILSILSLINRIRTRVNYRVR